MTGMTNINPAAETARESARKTNGEFGRQDRSAPEVGIAEPGVQMLTTDGEELELLKFYRPYEGYTPLTLADARISLRIPANESDDVVRETVALLQASDQGGYAPFFERENRYSDPGDDSLLSTEEWGAPSEGMAWEGTARVWRDRGDSDVHYYVEGTARFSLTDIGFTAEQSIAADEIATAHLISMGEYQDGASVEVSEGEMRLVTLTNYRFDEFSPSLVERKMNWHAKNNDPRSALRARINQAIILDDDAIVASRDISGRAPMYAAANGRIPTDAEAVAICREYELDTTLTRGYEWADSRFALPGAPDDVRNAMSLWANNKVKEKA